MIIIHKIDDFLFNLFPKAKEAGKSVEILKNEKKFEDMVKLFKMV